MTPWETTAVMAHWAEVHDTGRSGHGMSNNEADEIWAWLKDNPAPATLAEARGHKGNGVSNGAVRH